MAYDDLNQFQLTKLLLERDALNERLLEDAKKLTEECDRLCEVERVCEETARGEARQLMRVRYVEDENTRLRAACNKVVHAVSGVVGELRDVEVDDSLPRDAAYELASMLLAAVKPIKQDALAPQAAEAPREPVLDAAFEVVVQWAMHTDATPERVGEAIEALREALPCDAFAWSDRKLTAAAEDYFGPGHSPRCKSGVCHCAPAAEAYGEAAPDAYDADPVSKAYRERLRGVTDAFFGEPAAPREDAPAPGFVVLRTDAGFAVALATPADVVLYATEREAIAASRRLRAAYDIATPAAPPATRDESVPPPGWTKTVNGWVRDGLQTTEPWKAWAQYDLEHGYAPTPREAPSLPEGWSVESVGGQRFARRVGQRFPSLGLAWTNDDGSIGIEAGNAIPAAVLRALLAGDSAPVVGGGK